MGPSDAASSSLFYWSAIFVSTPSWFIFLNSPEFRVSLKTHLWVFPRVITERFNWTGTMHPKCCENRLGSVLNKEEKVGRRVNSYLVFGDRERKMGSSRTALFQNGTEHKEDREMGTTVCTGNLLSPSSLFLWDRFSYWIRNWAGVQEAAVMLLLPHPTWTWALEF